MSPLVSALFRVKRGTACCGRIFFEKGAGAFLSVTREKVSVVNFSTISFGFSTLLCCHWSWYEVRDLLFRPRAGTSHTDNLMRVPAPFSPVSELQAVFQPLRRVVAPFHTLWILCRQVGPEYTCMDIYISRCSFLHDSTLVPVPVTTEQSRERSPARALKGRMGDFEASSLFYTSLSDFFVHSVGKP